MSIKLNNDITNLLIIYYVNKILYAAINFTSNTNVRLYPSIAIVFA